MAVATAFKCLLCHRDDVPRSRQKRDLCEDCPASLAARNLAWCARGKHRVKADDMDRASCKACESLANARRYQRERDMRLAKQRAYYEANPGYRRAAWLRYNAKHGAEINARRRERYQNDPDYRAKRQAIARKATNQAAARARTARWRAANAERHKATMRAYRQEQKLKTWRGIRA